MSRKWIAGLVALAAVGGTAVAATAALSTGADTRPPTATVTVDLSDERANARPKGGIGGGSTKKPRLVYLQSSTPETINPADPAAGGVGPYIDVKLTGCAKVIDGGVVPSRFDVYQQGSYVKSPSEYHVLISLDNEALGNRTPFTITSNLTCLKGVK
jgi:ABC-type transport system substrate-binding protein